LPWSELFAARGRALAARLERDNDIVRRELARVHAALSKANLKAFLPQVDAALAA
jgi:hypothetical protein